MMRRLQEIVAKKRLDAAVFLDAANIQYFADVAVDQGTLVVPKKGRAKLFVGGFEASRLAKLSQVPVVKAKKGFVDELRGAYSRIGVVEGKMPLSVAKKFSCEDLSEDIANIRVKKSKEELSRITKACAITDMLFDEMMQRSFTTERDMLSFLLMRMAQLDVEPSFSPIIATGKNASVPHHVPTHAKLSGFTVIDFGVKYKGYCSDMTRTVFVGKPSEKEKKAYNNLRKVQEQCIEKVQQRVSFAAINEFAKKAVGKSMVHSIGHSLGIDVHDVQPKEWVLEEGNVVTIEPGTYRSFGIRIEDDVYLSPKGPLPLNQSSKDFLVIQKV